MAVGSLLLSAYLVMAGVLALTQEPAELRETKDVKSGRRALLTGPSEPSGEELGQQILTRNMFDSKTGALPWEIARDEPTEGEGTDATGAPEWIDCPSELRLLASIVSASEENSVVSVRMGEESRVMRVGDVIADMELTAIEPTYAYFLTKEGSSCALPLFLVGPPPPRLLAAPLGKQARQAFFAATELDESITELGAGRYQVSRHLADRARANGGAAIVQGVKFQPRVRKGKVQGMRVKKIREDSLLYRLGVRDGDLLRSVNGFAIDGPDGMLSAYNALQDQTRLTLSISRKGKVESLQYMFE